MDFWHRYRIHLLIIICVVLSPFIFQFSLFDGKYIGETKGVVKKTYYKTYGVSRGRSSLPKAKLMIEGIGLVNVICEVRCIVGSNINVQIYRPFFFGEDIYIYEDAYNKLFKRDK